MMKKSLRVYLVPHLFWGSEPPAGTARTLYP